MRSFQSDNQAGLCPEARQAILDADDGSHAPGYGDDALTARAAAAFRDLFGPDTGVGFVANGTAANLLAIASLTEPWQRVLCHEFSHYNADESTGPERLTGCRTTPIATELSAKLTPDLIAGAIADQRGDVHEPQPGVLTVSNVSEFGAVYTPREMTAICEVAHGAGYRVHVDGARFANAVAALDCEARELSVEAGVDALSFGGTKNGLALGEAVLFFPQGDGSAYETAVRRFPFLRKSAGQLLSKHRFLTAPFAATLTDGVWLRHAAHANAMAARLAQGLERLGLTLRFPRQANGVFVSLPDEVEIALRDAGYSFYHFGPARWRMARFMCSFDTQPDDVDAFLNAAGGVSATPPAE